MKSKNMWKVIWIIGVYSTLVLILYLVVVYKVKWEDLDLNKYMYFYKCSNDVCTSESKTDKYYSYILCPNYVCPQISEKKDNLVILKNSDNSKYLYNYISNKVITNEFKNYEFIDNNDYIIATNNDDKQGIIDYDGKRIIDFVYDKITNYNNGYLSYMENNKMGIINNENSINIPAKYYDIIIIDSKKYAYRETINDGYTIVKYNSEKPLSNIQYDYLYADRGVIFTVKDKKIDILNNELHSKLLMKINTYYPYKNDDEINSLNIYTKGNLLFFSVYSGNSDEFKEYVYDILNNKLYNL